MAMDLETEPTPEPVAATPPAPAEPPAPPPEPTDPDESQAIEFQGGKMVPLDALKASRQENKDLKLKAADAEALRQQIARLEGTLQTYQQVQQQLQQPPLASTTQVSDPELVEIARSLDYYKGDGTPDLDRAAKFAALIDKKAESKARALVQPLQEQTAQDLSVRNYHAALQEKAPNGMAVDPQLLLTFWKGLPASYTADPRVARVIASMVLGEQLRAQPQQPAPPAHPPLVTEPVGGTITPRRQAVTEAERKVIEHRGMAEADYVKHTKEFRSGRLNPLEE